jgi:hypothetical protein
MPLLATSDKQTKPLGITDFMARFFNRMLTVAS